MLNQCRQNRTWRQVWLGVWKTLERFRILGKFQARLVDLLNLQFSTLTKPTGLTKPGTKPTGLHKPTGLNKPTGLTTFWKIAEIGKISWSAQFAIS